ncbi:MAG: hypothetical protein R3B39_01300 [Candidatus Paceibacterota bacterium]
MKILITILNSLSVIPIFVYPAILGAGIMSLDSPNNGFLGWTIFIISITYPLLIIGLIILSRKYTSLVLAIIAAIPFFIILYTLFFSNALYYKKRFSELEKDFVCGSGEFLSLGTQDEKISLPNTKSLYLLENKNFLSYKVHYAGTLYDNKLLYKKEKLNEGFSNKVDVFLGQCKDSEGKTPLELYKIISKEEIQKILRNKRYTK